MKKSETALLREELVKVTKEFKNRLEKTDKVVKDLTDKLARRDVEIDRLSLALADRDRRLAYYENPHVPPSKDSLYNAERAAFRKEMAKEDEAEKAKLDGEQADAAQDPDEPRGDLKENASRRGPPMGHAGASHQNKAEKTVELKMRRCRKCGSRKIDHLSPKIKMVYDFADDGTMRVVCVAYVIDRAACRACGQVGTAGMPTLRGTSLGPKALGFVYEYYYKRSTDDTIAYYFEALYGFCISANAIWNARREIRSLLDGTYSEILDHVLVAPFAQFDESPFKMNGKKGYVWLVTTKDATYLVAAPSRAAAVLDVHFGRPYGVPVVIDGYGVYGAFPVKQRCWIHILRKAERLACRHGGIYKSCYRRLLALYRSVKDKESAGCGKCLALEKTLLEITASYGESKFRGTLEAAAPHLFTFLRHPGMPPHNNAAEREIRDTAVLHRNVRHQLSTPEGRKVFSVLISVARTCHKHDMFPHVALANLIMDPDWSIFKPPDQQIAIPVTAA